MSDLYVYYARCEDCSGAICQTFDGRSARDKWVDAHKRGTGHRWFKQWKVTR